MELEHFSHSHQLILKQQLQYNGEEVICSGCEELISGPCYSCLWCYFFLHKKCSELPHEINHHCHPDHPLSLLAKPPSSYQQACLCDICDKTCSCFVYHCSICKFDLDVKCAFPPCLYEADSQGHQFRCLCPSVPLKSFSFTCNACGTDGDEPPFLCTMCLLMVHKRCISLPNTIRTNIHHHHQIVLTYSLVQDRSVKQFCGICLVEIRAGFGGYYCLNCDFVAHVSCALEFRVTRSESKKEELGTTVNDEFIESAAYTVREIKQGEDTVVVEIKHFSHQHNLILMDEVKTDVRCDGCMLPISSPCYGCVVCKFLLDVSCVELPMEKKLHYHDHPHSLISKAFTYDGVFHCHFCEQYCHGFVYRCDECEVSIDVRCINSMKTFIEHEGHEHPLLLAFGTEGYHCNACGVTGNSMLFKCTDYRFELAIRCANLPHKVWHQYDNHPLFLTYVDPNTYQFYCLICEKERDQNLWFYRCEECDFDAHPQCILGKNPYIKFGDTYTYSIHSHPLALVENTEGYSTCHFGGESCNDLALECTNSNCNFIIHRKRRGCMRLCDSDSEVE